MTDRPITTARPLITLGDAAAEACVDGWCVPAAAGLDADGEQASQPADQGAQGRHPAAAITETPS